MIYGKARESHLAGWWVALRRGGVCCGFQEGSWSESIIAQDKNWSSIKASSPKGKVRLETETQCMDDQWAQRLGEFKTRWRAGCRARRSVWSGTSHLWTRRESWSSFSMERVLSEMQGWVWWLKGICKAGHLSYCTLILDISSINFLSLSIPNFIPHLYSQTAVSSCPVHVPNTTALSLTQLSNMELDNLFLTFRKEYPLGLNTQYSVMT